MRPPYGICMPIRVARVIDGDTIEVTLPSGRSCVVRIDGYDAPEKNTENGVRAAVDLKQLLDGSPECALWLAWPTDRDNNGKLDLDELLHQFLVIGERIRGTVFAGDTAVDQWMIENGHTK